MEEPVKSESLIRWNELAREDAENDIVSSMFEATLKSSKPIDSFSTWLLVGTAAISSFIITNTDKLTLLTEKSNFGIAAILLFLSCLFGVLSKVFAVRCQVATEVQSAVKETFIKHIEEHEKEQEKIEKSAKFWNMEIETDVRIERILKEFLVPFPFWVKYLAMRHLKKNKGNPQVGYITVVRSLNAQGLLAFLQAFCFLIFIGLGMFLKF